jgi:hypothetical protein
MDKTEEVESDSTMDKTEEVESDSTMDKTEEVKSDSWEDKLSKKEEEWTRGREVWIYLRSLSENARWWRSVFEEFRIFRIRAIVML